MKRLGGGNRTSDEHPSIWRISKCLAILLLCWFKSTVFGPYWYCKHSFEKSYESGRISLHRWVDDKVISQRFEWQDENHAETSSNGELKTVSDASTHIVLHMELHEPKEDMAVKIYVPQFGATTACCLRITEYWKGKVSHKTIWLQSGDLRKFSFLGRYHIDYFLEISIIIITLIGLRFRYRKNRSWGLLVWVSEKMQLLKNPLTEIEWSLLHWAR